MIGPVITYLVPSRGRPQNAHRLLQAWHDTQAKAEIIFVLDDDDPTVKQYALTLHHWGVNRWHTVFEPSGMVGALNQAAREYAQHATYVGFMGDDHLPRTRNWDDILAARIESDHALFAYGDDLVQRHNLPTAILMRADVVRTLCQMAPPHLKHLYVDNYWLTLGQLTRRISYVPEVIIEHVHPITGHVEWDDGYKRVNSGEMYAHDQQVYDSYIASGQIQRDVEAIRDL